MMKIGEIREGGHIEGEQDVQGGMALAEMEVGGRRAFFRNGLRRLAEATDDTLRTLGIRDGERQEEDGGIKVEMPEQLRRLLEREEEEIQPSPKLEEELRKILAQAEALRARTDAPSAPVSMEEQETKDIVIRRRKFLKRAAAFAGAVGLGAFIGKKAAAEPVTLSANKPNPEGGSNKAGTKELTGEEIIHLERTQGRNMTLDEFIKTNTCKSEAAARLWAEHQEVQRENEKRRRENPQAALLPSPIQPEWPKEGEEGKKTFAKKGERVMSGVYVNFFSIESSVQDEEANIVVVKKFYLTASKFHSTTREPHNLFWAGYLGTDEEKAKRMAAYLLPKM